MDIDDSLRNSGLAVACKRPGPHITAAVRKVKKIRAEPRDDETDRSIWDNPNTDFLDDGLQLDCYGNSSFLARSTLGNSGGNSTCSQGYATTPSTCSETHGPQSEQSVFGESRTNELLSQSPPASPEVEYIEVSSDYDTCFGVIVATPISSFGRGNGTCSIPVKLKPYGGGFILYSQNADIYVGLLSSSALVIALRQPHLKLDATLFITTIKDTRGASMSKTRKQTTGEAAREYTLRVVIYGLRDDKEMVGDLISDAGHFLQHPYVMEVLPGIQYDNPHYLRRPGAEMPKLEHFDLDNVYDDYAQTEIGDEINKSRFLRIMETAAADGMTVTEVNISPSPRLCSPLMRHQIIALAMMYEKESGYVEEPMFPSLWRKEATSYRHTVTGSLEPRPIPVMGGILADDMGLGKTLSVLALICTSLDVDSQATLQNQKREHQGTLIVAPKSTIYGWITQASEHIHEGQIRIIVYHGSGRESLVNKFRDTDVVVTTYETLRSEWETPEGTSPLLSWKWLRVILDEAHHIRNRLSKTFRSVYDLAACYRWCLTGTPIHNSLDDYGALLSFIRVFPFVQKPRFMSCIVQPVENKNKLGLERLRRLIRATCLRRTKHKTLELPPRFEKLHEVYLHRDDQALYDFYKQICAQKVAGQRKRGEGPERGSEEYNILSLITCLRRICDHGEQLLSDAVKEKREESSTPFRDLEIRRFSSSRCSVCGSRIDDSASGTKDRDTICTNCATSEEGSADSAKTCCSPSAKVLALLENIRQDRARGNAGPRKSVVFSSWVKMIDLVQQAFYREQINFQRIDGQTSLDGRRKALQEFNGNPDCIVMLATIGSSAEGLTVASTVHILEPHWNPMVEAQAIDRVHRIGQMQEVKVIRYIVPNSIEIYVQQIQDEKMQIINETMDMNSVAEADLESRRWERLKNMLA
ncbi:SNF2 family N-terminal domain-containing protein [Hypomontagnella monticulosa]|nr:SNF2 family N-terminal domain-containing protein [Hypomontagnella monticulosa]